MSADQIINSLNPRGGRVVLSVPALRLALERALDAARNEALLEVEEGLGSSRSPAQPGSVKPRLKGAAPSWRARLMETLICLTREQRDILSGFLIGPCFYKHGTLHAAGLLGRGLLHLTTPARGKGPAQGGWYEITTAGRCASQVPEAPKSA